MHHDAIEPGRPGPAFTLPDQDDKEVSLSDYAGKTVVVYFYPAAMTPGCTTEACDFRDSLQSLAASDVVVFGISPDKPAKLRKFADRDSLTFPCCPTPTGASWKPMELSARRRCTARRLKV